jgi:rRNA maturation RNase YbeY
MIAYNTIDVKMPVFPKRKISNWIKQEVLKFQKRVGDVTYIFCSDPKILEINNEYLSHDYYTDIITFDYSEGDTISGDLFISIDTVRSNATKFAVSYEEELYRVMIHGILHLCGIDDKTPDARQKMHECEDRALSDLYTIRVCNV